MERERRAWGLLNSSLSVKINLGLIQWDIPDMLCSHNSLGLAGELVYNQQGNIVCLDILNCYDTSSWLLIASWFHFLSSYAVGSCLNILQWNLLLHTSWIFGYNNGMCCLLIKILFRFLYHWMYLMFVMLLLKMHHFVTKKWNGSIMRLTLLWNLNYKCSNQEKQQVVKIQKVINLNCSTI